jgi:hypothetical protein
MSNDISTPAPAAAPPSSTPAPSTPIEPTSPETLDVLSTPERVDAYAEQRQEDQGQINQGMTETERQQHRRRRLKEQRDQARAENAAKDARIAELEARSSDGTPESMERWQDEVQHPEQTAAQDAELPAEPAGDTNGQQEPYVATPEEREAYLLQVRELQTREADIRADYRAAERQFATEIGPERYRAALESVDHVELPDHVMDLLRSSPYGPKIGFALASTEDGKEYLKALPHMHPMDAARFIQKCEDAVEFNAHQRAMQQRQPQQYAPQRRVTAARPPIAPLRGNGAAPPRNTAELAENMSAYAADFNRRMKNRLDR